MIKRSWVRISSNTRWKWFQSHTRIDCCTQSWLSHQMKIKKIQLAKLGTPKKYLKNQITYTGSTRFLNGSVRFKFRMKFSMKIDFVFTNSIIRLSTYPFIEGFLKMIVIGIMICEMNREKNSCKRKIVVFLN